MRPRGPIQQSSGQGNSRTQPFLWAFPGPLVWLWSSHLGVPAAQVLGNEQEVSDSWAQAPESL